MEIKKLILSIGLVIVFLGVIEYKNDCKTEPVEVIEETQIEQDQVEVLTCVEPEEEPKTTIYRVTAYCPCEWCCGKWAKNRPHDANGEPIVYGASGEVLVSGVSCASPITFGTQIELDWIGIVEVQDRTATWVVDKYGDNIIDIYMTEHEAAKKFGVQYIEGVVK